MALSNTSLWNSDWEVLTLKYIFGHLSVFGARSIYRTVVMAYHGRSFSVRRAETMNGETEPSCVYAISVSN